MTPLWTENDTLKITGGTPVNGNGWTATGLQMDSRLIQTGDLFIAMPSETGAADSHDFVQSAYEKGAIAAIVSRTVDCPIPQIVVPDTFQALKDLGQAAHARAPLDKVIGITGSVGKTGTREMVKFAFQACDRITHASIKSYNNHVGVPYTLATMPATTEIGVFEMGMNHAGEITPLSHQVQPDIAIITWIDAVHIENFPDGMQGIINAKSEIFDGMSGEGITILPHDNPHFEALETNATNAGLQNIYSFGEHADSDARLISCTLTAEGSQIEADIMGEAVTYTLQIAGKHIAVNSLSALLAVKLSGLDIQASAKGMEALQPIEGRGKREWITLSNTDAPVLLIDEGYNASPPAMRAAFQVLKMVEPSGNGRRVAILGDMRELGDQSRTLHEGLLPPLLDANIDIVYCCCPYMKHLHDLLPPEKQGGHYETSTDLAAAMSGLLRGGDAVLVKGSLGSNMKVIVEAIRKLGHQNVV